MERPDFIDEASAGVAESLFDYEPFLGADVYSVKPGVSPEVPEVFHEAFGSTGQTVELEPARLEGEEEVATVRKEFTYNWNRRVAIVDGGERKMHDLGPVLIERLLKNEGRRSSAMELAIELCGGNTSKAMLFVDRLVNHINNRLASTHHERAITGDSHEGYEVRKQEPKTKETKRIYEWDDIWYDRETGEYRREGAEPVALSPTEKKFFDLLLDHRGDVVSITAIEKEVWGVVDDLTGNYRRLYTQYLRKKIGEDMIITHRGRGLELAGPKDSESEKPETERRKTYYDNTWFTLNKKTGQYKLKRNGVYVNDWKDHHRLSLKELELLVFLSEFENTLVSNETILNEVWGPEYKDDAHYVRLYMRYLRVKLGNGEIDEETGKPLGELIISNKRGVGYKLNNPLTAEKPVA